MTLNKSKSKEPEKLPRMQAIVLEKVKQND